jgi:phosphoribosylformylglycinamidine (FGAM) synthase-like amidotransferase family enzyme
MKNTHLHYVCKDVHLRVECADSIFTHHYDAGSVLRIPIAHGEGNYFADQTTLDRLEDEDLVAFRYVDAAGGSSPEANPNGSRHDIAGIFDPTRRVLGMMPHPERLADAKLGGTDGRPMFDGLVEALS